MVLKGHKKQRKKKMYEYIYFLIAKVKKTGTTIWNILQQGPRLSAAFMTTTTKKFELFFPNQNDSNKTPESPLNRWVKLSSATSTGRHLNESGW